MVQLTPPEASWAQTTGLLAANSRPHAGAAPSVNGSSAAQVAWLQVIDGQLADWAKDPHRLEDDGVEPPSGEIVRVAIEIAIELRDADFPAPSRVAATGDGGIVFARQEGPLLSTIEVAADGTVELVVLKDARLLSRRRLR